jgi:DNA-binding GntR family transcriptional regulator
MTVKSRTFLPEEIYSFVRFKIVAGEYPPGSRINVNKLSGNFGISRIPVRDVINRLCGEGLIYKGSNDRFLVAPLTEADVRETYELRGLFEGYLAKQAATDFREEDLRLLEENVREQEREKTNIENYIKLNTEFHEYFFKATQNKKFINCLKKLRDYQLRFDRINWMTHGSFFVNLTLGQHREILDAVKRQNGELAEKMIKLHMNTGVEFLIKALKEKNLLE